MEAYIGLCQNFYKKFLLNIASTVAVMFYLKK